jgi:hypothetical protein
MAGYNLTVCQKPWRQKKPSPERGPVSVFAGVGAGNIVQRGTSCAPVILGGYASGATASTEYANANAPHQRRWPHASHAWSRISSMSNEMATSCGFRQPKHEMLKETKSASAVRWRRGSREDLDARD